MKNFYSSGLAALFAVFVLGSALAQDRGGAADRGGVRADVGDPFITMVVVVDDVIQIWGRDFIDKDGGCPVVRLAWQGEDFFEPSLNVTSLPCDEVLNPSISTYIEAELPAGTEPGDYLLSVAQFYEDDDSSEEKKAALWDLTIGAVGEIGPQGVQGKLGDTGAQGVQGKLGDTGAQGVQGKLGDTGAQGVQGKLGDTGAQGVQGKLGDTGAQGVQGKLGDTGAQGVQGKLGDTGAQGVQGKLGDTGAQGVQGKLGDPGAQGVQGKLGDTGAQGVQGKLGDTGAQGVQGKLGDTGAQGVQGKLGDTGAQGVQGKLGDTGAQGVQGKLGDTGAQGVQGKLGDTGAQGVQGKLGDTGAQGVQGKLGDTGAQGVQGKLGDTGAQGVQGKLGDTGAQGVQGKLGDTGAQGVQGKLGDTGAQGVQGKLGPQGEQGPPGPVAAIGTTCPPGQAVVGMDDDGRFICSEFVQPPPPLNVFLTSGYFTGDLVAHAIALGYSGTDGLEAGDFICNSSADTAGLGGTYKAWLSTSTVDAKDRLTTDDVPWIRPGDGVQVASSLADLIDGSIDAAIINDEYGNIAYNDVNPLGGHSNRAWSHTNGDGTKFVAPFINSCADWTSGVAPDHASSAYVNPGALDDQWTIGDSGRPCGQLIRLYCFGQ